MHLELAFRHGDDCCLVFPWANGNLNEYWESHPRDPTNERDILWLFEQCSGIALGLRRLHNPSSHGPAATVDNGGLGSPEDIPAQNPKYGRHGDISPNNILWFDDYKGSKDHLVVSDFGLAEFKSIFSKSHVDPNGLCGWSGTYQAPDRHTDKELTQKYDVWSLGCVFLEFAVWLLLGYEQMIRFVNERVIAPDGAQDNVYKGDTFFQLEKGGTGAGGRSAKVKPCVLKVRLLYST